LPKLARKASVAVSLSGSEYVSEFLSHGKDELFQQEMLFLVGISADLVQAWTNMHGFDPSLPYVRLARRREHSYKPRRDLLVLAAFR